jgi:hypothetical protein
MRLFILLQNSATLDKHFQTSSQFFISNFRRAVNVAFSLLGDTPPSEFYLSTFRNTLFHIHKSLKQPMTYEYGTVCVRNVGTENSDAGESPKRENTSSSSS